MCPEAENPPGRDSGDRGALALPDAVAGAPPSGSFDPEAYLDSLEPIGWRLGLDRMTALCEELARPQDRFGTIHVVGTNGKSSVARMTAAVLEADGIRAGCMISPHLSSWSERVIVSGRELDPHTFGEAVRRTATAAAVVNSRLDPEDSVTQFEIASAAGFLALAEAGVEVAAVEAGLGGRLDATNSIDSSVTVLTSIGLDHTEWLGETEVGIAAEKVDVLRPGTVLVLGRVADEVRTLAIETALARDCRVVEPGDDLPAGVEPASPALYQRANFALAIAASEWYLEAESSRRKASRSGKSPVVANPIPRKAILEASASAAVPGRLERVSSQPPVFIDVAHNRPGAAALAASVPGIARGRPVIGLIGILDDKDACGIIAELAPVLDRVVFSQLPQGVLLRSARPGARGWPLADLMRFAAEAGLDAEALAKPVDALGRARQLATERHGVVLVAGSHYLLAPGSEGGATGGI